MIQIGVDIRKLNCETCESSAYGMCMVDGDPAFIHGFAKRCPLSEVEILNSDNVPVSTEYVKNEYQRLCKENSIALSDNSSVLKQHIVSVFATEIAHIKNDPNNSRKMLTIMNLENLLGNILAAKCSATCYDDNTYRSPQI